MGLVQGKVSHGLSLASLGRLLQSLPDLRAQKEEKHFSWPSCSLPSIFKPNSFVRLPIGGWSVPSWLVTQPKKLLSSWARTTPGAISLLTAEIHQVALGLVKVLVGLPVGLEPNWQRQRLLRAASVRRGVGKSDRLGRGARTCHTRGVCDTALSLLGGTRMAKREQLLY